MIKRTLSFLLALLMTFTVLTTLPLAIGASDGGQGRLSITSHADDDVVRGDRDVIIRWTAVPGAGVLPFTPRRLRCRGQESSRECRLV